MFIDCLPRKTHGILAVPGVPDSPFRHPLVFCDSFPALTPAVSTDPQVKGSVPENYMSLHFRALWGYPCQAIVLLTNHVQIWRLP